MSKSCCRRKPLRPATNYAGCAPFLCAAALLVCLVAAPSIARGSDQAPSWMHAAAAAPLPAYDEEADAVLLYAEENITVQSVGSMRATVRRAYKILRPGGRDYGYVGVPVGPHRKILGLRGWCIPASGKDYQVKDKDAVEVSLSGVGFSELVNDVKERVIRIPAAEPGSVVGYEYEVEEQPLVLQDYWAFQTEVPSRESHYSLELPNGWTYLSKWINYPEVKATEVGNNHWQWALSEVKAVHKEEHMPAEQAVAGRMIIYFVPPGGAPNAFTDWKQMGDWYRTLAAGRLDPSPEMKQTVDGLTAKAATPLAKMQAIALFVQRNLRYVAIELGIGGYQPHPATEVLAHRYGDCKDKATLTIAMLREIGVEAFYVIINVHREVVTADTPAYTYAFNHAIVAIRLPDSVKDASLMAILQHPKYGRLLFFDPTNELTPFGQVGGYLQASYGLLVTPDGGELVQVPTLPPAANTIQRIAKLTLDSSGTLRGDVSESRIGDRASSERQNLSEVAKESERIKPIENLLAGSLSNFRLTNANIVNQHNTELPFGFIYSFEAPNYAKSAGGLLLVRPRVLGIKARSIAKSKRPRQYPFEFDAVALDTDNFDITIPSGYQVDDLPPAANADYSFGSYHSTTQVDGSTIHYHRAYEIKQLNVPVDQADQLKSFYQVIAGDERSMVVLKPALK